MSSRPEVLFKLFSDLTSLSGVGPKIAANFGQIDIEKPRDLLFTPPVSGVDRTVRKSLSDCVIPGIATVSVEVGMHVPARAKGRPYYVHVKDATSEFRLVFFHAHADFLLRHLPVGQRRIVSGKVELFDGIAQMVHPDHMVAEADAATLPKFEPVYPLTHGVTQKTFWKASEAALDLRPDLVEWIDPQLKSKERWPDWSNAVLSAHRPQSAADVSPDTGANADWPMMSFLHIS